MLLKKLLLVNIYLLKETRELGNTVVSHSNHNESKQ